MNVRLSRRWKIFISFGLVFALVAIIGVFSLPTLLIASLPTDAAQLPATDVIIHWATGPHSESDQWVAELYRQGKAKQILCVSTPVSWEVYAADFARQHLISLGIPAENVLSLHLELEPCSAPNAKQVAAYAKAQGWHSALVVTGVITAGSRLEKYFHQEGVTLARTYSPQDRDELTRSWWREHWKIQYLIGSAVEILLDSMYAECR